MQTMTMRERMIAVIKGEPHDRVPFAQGFDVGAPNDEIWEVVGHENMGVSIWGRVDRQERPNCSREEEGFARDGLKGQRSILRTPKGMLTKEVLFDPVLNSASTEQHFVKDIADYEILKSYLEDTVVTKDFEQYYTAAARVGGYGMIHLLADRTPYQQLWIQWVSIEDLCLHMVDAPEVIDEIMTLMGMIARQIYMIICEAVRDPEVPVYSVLLPDNITAPLIGVDKFNKYCVSFYNELGAMLDETGQDIPILVHMDGDLQPLTDAIGKSRVRGLDSMSPPPDNDISVAKARSLWPEMRLLVNFPSSVHLADEETIYRTACQIIEESGDSGRLQIQISENVPPGEWKKSYPQIIRAINDCGKIG